MNLSPLFISLKISLTALVFTFFIGITLAYKMYNYKGRFKTIIDSAINLPIVLPPVATGFFLLILLGKNGFVGKFLNSININIIFSWQAGVIASVVITLPLMYRAVYSSLCHLDRDLIDTARSFGASEFQVFLYVVMPMSSHGIIGGALLSFTRSLGEFGATLMIAGNIPNKTQTIASAIYFYASSGDYKQALIWVVTIVAISFMFLFFASTIEKTA